MAESQNFGKSTAEQVRKAALEKLRLNKEIENLEIELSQKDASIKRFDDELVVMKGHKRFLDVLAI